MTISSDSIKNSYSTTGKTTGSLLDITFSYFDNSEIEVYLRTSAGVESKWALTTNYTITGSPGASPKVKLVTDPADGGTIVIRRKTPFTQLVDYASGDAFPADSHETALDRVVALAQQLKEILERSLSYPNTYENPSGRSIVIPEPENNAIIKWNADATALVNDTDLATSTYKLKVTDNELTPNYLDNKLLGGTGLTKDTSNNPSGEESITFNVDAAQTQITSVGALNGGSITTGFGAIDVGTDAITTSGAVTGGTLVGTVSTATQNSITTATGLTSTGALDAGSITSNFGNINVGSSSVTAGSAVINSTIGHTDDTDLMTLADGSLTVKGTVTVGVDDTGHDVKFFGAESGSHLLWDESDNSLETAGNATINVVKDKLLIGGTAVTTTAAELNLLDGVSGLAQSDFTKLAAVDSTANELNLLDGSAKSTSSITIADDDAFLVIDGTTSKQIPASDIKTYAGGGGGVGSIDTIFTMQAKTASAASAASGDDAVFRGAAASVTSAPALVTTAGNLINTDKVFKYTSASGSTNDWWLYSESIPQGYQNRNMVLQLQYYMVETSGDNLTNAFRFVARDATNGKVTQLNGAVSSSNTITLDAFADGDFTVGDRVTFKDTSGNIHFRYITSVTHGSEQLTISGAAVTIADDAYFVSGILTDELDYLPNFKPTTAGQDGSKAYKKQLVIPSNCDTLEFGFHYLGSQTDQFLYYDDIALSANQFLQTSSQGLSEQGWWADPDGFASNTSVPYFGTEHINTTGKLVTVTNSSASNTGWTLTANEKVKVDVSANFANGSTGDGWGAWLKNAPQSVDETDVTSSTMDPYRLAISLKGTSVGSGNNCTVAVVLEKGDTLRFQCTSTSLTSSPYGGQIVLVATPEANDVVLLNSQDEIFTDWVDFDPVWSQDGGSAGPVAPTSYVHKQLRWRRVGSNMEIDGYFNYDNAGTNGSSTYTLALPSGYTIAPGELYLNLSKNSSQFVGQGLFNNSTTMNIPCQVRAYSESYLFFTYGTSNVYVDGGVGFAAGNWRLSFRASVPIAGWTSTFNPVLSMPLVDFGSFENVYSARCTISSSTVTVVSQSPPNWLDASASSGAATSVLKTQGGIFSVIPTATVTPTQMGPGGDEIALVLSNTTIDGSGVVSFSMAGGDIEGNIDVASIDFNIVAMRQGSDYRQQPQPTAAVIKPAVCIIEEQLAQNTAGGSGGGGYMQRKCNVIYGESWFVSGITGSLGVDGTNNQFDLDPGTYEVEGFSCTHKTDGGYSLMDSTDNEIKIFGVNKYNAASSNGDGNQPFQGVFTITAKKTFKIWTYGQSSDGTYGRGVQVNVSGRPEKYMSCKIRKLK